MSIINDVNQLVTYINRDESLSAMLREVVKQQSISRSFPKNYYFVTHLTNPTETYYSRIYPEIKIHPELGRKLARGTQLHNFASHWFTHLPNFIIDEGTVDGIWEGIDGVRGKIDYFVGDSILEFKTKDKNPDDEEDIFLHYPQDLEQLAFYSVIHPSKPEINYLVFMENTPPYDFKAFKVKIENRDNIRNILKSRINSLDKAIENKNPSSLGRCRYYKFECKFVTNKICLCDEFGSISLDKLKKSLSINFDPGFTSKLEEARKKSQISDTFCLTTFDIIAPRKHYINTVLGIESNFEGDPLRDEYQACLWTSVNILKNKFDIYPDDFKTDEIKKSIRDYRVKIGFRWLKIKKSGETKESIVPYILKVSRVKNIKRTRKPSQYSLTELGIICGLYGKVNGVIFTVYPHLDNLIIAYNVAYKSDKQLFRLIKEKIDNIEAAEKKQNLFLLPECPDFFDYDKKCPLTEICHSPKEKRKKEKKE